MFRQRERVGLQLEYRTDGSVNPRCIALAIDVPTNGERPGNGFVRRRCSRSCYVMILPKRFVPAPMRNRPDERQ